MMLSQILRVKDAEASIYRYFGNPPYSRKEDNSTCV